MLVPHQSDAPRSQTSSFAYKDQQAKGYQEFVERVYESSINDEVDNLCGRADDESGRRRTDEEMGDDQGGTNGDEEGDGDGESKKITEKTKAQINALRIQVRRELIGQGIASLLQGDGISMDEVNVGSWALEKGLGNMPAAEASSPAKGANELIAPGSVARSVIPGLPSSIAKSSAKASFKRATSSRKHLNPAAMAEAQEIAKRERLRSLRRETRISSCDVRAETGRHLVTERERWKGSFRDEHAELMGRLRGR